jgi:hypothetical protein
MDSGDGRSFEKLNPWMAGYGVRGVAEPIRLTMVEYSNDGIIAQRHPIGLSWPVRRSDDAGGGEWSTGGFQL